ncbi:Peptide chain release factor 1 [Escherichia coli]|nr:Peptide chain release factor 1 [Escherichia coli]
MPTGIVECQDERSQHKNKLKHFHLGARIHAAEMAKRQQAEASTRRNLLGSGDRSDRNRTYNFPQGRVTDHRINLTLYRLDEVMEGKLDMLIEPIIQEHQADQLAALSEQE